MNMNEDFYAGASLGALVGCLLGFSSQSVVAGTIAAILTLTAGFIGVAQPAAFAPKSDDGNQNKRIFAFGIFATLSFLICNFLNLNHVFEPSITDNYQALSELKFPSERIQVLIGAKYFNALPSDWKKP